MEKYYLFGYLVIHLRDSDDDYPYEYYIPGKGWLADKPGPYYRDFRSAIHDAMHGYGDYSPSDINVITEEMAQKIVNKQEELNTTNISGLTWGGIYNEK